MSGEREEKQLPLIPGVSRGGDFFRGKSIEAAGQKLASRRRMEYGSIPLDLCLVENDKAEFLTFPYLGREESSGKYAQLWEPRVDPKDGGVIITRWQKPKPGRTDFSEYFAFAGENINSKFNYSQVPPGWRIGILVPQKIKDGIEAAMRQQNEIAHDYGKNRGPEDDRITEITNRLYEISSAFSMGDVKSEQDLNALAMDVEDLFKTHGIIDTGDSVWQKVVEYTMKAADKDRLNRINPLISRTRVRAAFLAITEREMIGRSIGTKADKVYRRLSIVRNVIRMKIKTAADALNDNLGEYGGVERCTVKTGWNLEQLLKTISQDVLGNIQPAPYLEPVLASRAILIGEQMFKNNNEKQAGLRILSADQAARFLNFPAVYGLRHGNLAAAMIKMKNARWILEAILEDPKTKDIKVFDR
jgi:hypothetical protein